MYYLQMVGLHLHYLEAFYEAKFINALGEIERLTFLYPTQDSRESGFTGFCLTLQFTHKPLWNR